MADENESPQAGDNQPGNGQEPDLQDEKDVAKLRSEAAKWRTQFRDAQKQIGELKPQAEQYQKLQESQKTEAQKQADRIAELEKQTAEANASAQAAQRQAKLTILAGKAKVDPELLPLLDISKINLDDEAEALKALGKFATVRQQGGGASNPERGGEQGKSDAELRAEIFGARHRSSIFGG